MNDLNFKVIILIIQFLILTFNLKKCFFNILNQDFKILYLIIRCLSSLSIKFYNKLNKI